MRSIAGKVLVSDIALTLAPPLETPFRLPRGAAGFNLARRNTPMSDPETPDSEPTAPAPAEAEPVAPEHVPPRERPPREIGGRESGLDPTRYGDWEKNGRCIDF
jgi:hypothetical protein